MPISSPRAVLSRSCRLIVLFIALLVGGLGAVGAVFAGSITASGINLPGINLGDVTPHRAIYRLSLDTVKEAGSIQQADGLIAFQWQQSCQAVLISEAYAIRLYLSEGQVTEFGATFEGSETLDGQSFEFSFEETGAGEAKAIRGEAQRKLDRVELLLKPREKTSRSLERDVVFPGFHTAALIAAAEAGRKILVLQVFDGSDINGPTLVSAGIGKERKVEELMGSDRGWPMTLAFFSDALEEETPSYQLTMILRENGIASDLRLDYGAFALKGELDVLEEQPKPNCG